MGFVTGVTLRTPPCSSVYIDACPFSFPWFAGIARYTARLSLALTARVPVRFFDYGQELLIPEGLDWSQDQDLEAWGRQIWQSERRPLGTPPAGSIGLYCAPRLRQQLFSREVSILHDLCPMVLPWAFPKGTQDGFGKFLTDTLPASDVVVADSHSTKADAAWFSSLDSDQIVVALPGPSLCVQTHRHRGPVARTNRIGLVVSTIEPRKNARFLFEWFHNTKLLPPDMELFWVGKLGWMMSREEIELIANPPGGRRIRLLENVSDARLCELYQTASWSIYPSKYEGFGFPILDSLRHGTPVLTSYTSSMREFDHEGVFFFDPDDPATVDVAWQRLEAARPVTIPQAPLEERYNWDAVANTLLLAVERSGDSRSGGLIRSSDQGSNGHGGGHTEGGRLPASVFESPMTSSRRVKDNAGLRIGVELIGTQSGGRHRGIGRYSRTLVANLLARDPDNHYVLYGHDGLPTDQIPRAPNAVIRLLRPDPDRGERTLAHVMERLAESNPDGLDLLLLLNPLELALGFDPPARPVNGLKIFTVVYDMIPWLFQEQYFPLCGGPEFARRYHQGLNRLRSYDALLAISEATRSDIVSSLGLPPDRVITIGAASDGQFFVPDRTDPMPAESRALLRVLGITRPFVFAVGAVDYRKDLWGLIDAFAMLPVDLRRAHQLVVCYGLSEADRDRVRKYADERGVADQLVLTTWISDKALRVLYQRCEAFVFSSSYEGFGLPILEAMHCGAPVVAGNNSSQIEVVGDAGLLFNIGDAGELVAQLVSLLDDSARAQEFRERAVVQARRFSWEVTADKALEVLTRSHASGPTVHPRRRAKRPRIAFFSPLPPVSSEVADYSARLIDELKSRYKIDLYHDAGYLPHTGLRSPEFGCYDHRLFERNAAVLGYHAVVYQMGNSPCHGYMYETLLRQPGIVTLHDLGLGDSSEQGHHLNGRVFERASAVIVHSPWCLEQVRSQLPAHLGKTSVVAIGATAMDLSPEERKAVRARFNLPPEALVIASLGAINPTKMNCETIAAFAPLARAIPEALLIFAGTERDNGEARREVRDLGLQHRVRFLGQHPAEVRAELAAIADIGICLRRPPTNGESSGALMDFLRLGVATIVSDVGSFSCYPDSVVRKHRWESKGLAGLTEALRELAENGSRRQVLGRAAWQYVRENHAWARVADLYQEIIERSVTRRSRRRADGPGALPGPQAVASMEWIEALS